MLGDVPSIFLCKALGIIQLISNQKKSHGFFYLEDSIPFSKVVKNNLWLVNKFPNFVGLFVLWDPFQMAWPIDSWRL